MLVTVRLFAMLRERAGTDSLELELAEGSTATEAIEAVAERHDLGDMLDRLPLAVAINREYAERSQPLGEGDEVALIPPVSGGANPATAVHVRVTGEPLSAADLSAEVGRPGAGAIVTFQGTTREVERLEYEAYVEMAEGKIAAILAEVAEAHGVEAIAAEHRIGVVPRGEPSVVVAVSAAHRGEAFAAAREAIDRIKAEPPIWKKEVDASGGGRWVEGSPPSGQ